MKCNQTDNTIPQLLRREIDSYARLDAITHLRQCPECRKVYYQYLNMFYAIDRNIVQPEEKLNMNNFKESVKKQILTHKPRQNTAQVRYLIYAAAAVLLIFTILYSIYQGTFTSYPTQPGSESISLKEHLVYEDWQSINSILQDPERIEECMDEKIPIALLRDKLISLQNRGIHSISFASPHSSDKSKKTEIQIFEMLSALDRFRQGPAASIWELSKFEIISKGI